MVVGSLGINCNNGITNIFIAVSKTVWNQQPGSFWISIWFVFNWLDRHKGLLVCVLKELFLYVVQLFLILNLHLVVVRFFGNADTLRQRLDSVFSGGRHLLNLWDPSFWLFLYIKWCNSIDLFVHDFQTFFFNCILQILAYNSILGQSFLNFWLRF